MSGSRLASENGNGELPEGWECQPVGEVFRCFGGSTPNKGTSAYWGGDIPWLSSGDIKTERISCSSESITQAAIDAGRNELCRPGAIVVVVRSGILRHTLPVGLLAIRSAINQDMKCFDSGDDSLNEWLALALRANAIEILKLNREGTTVQSVKTETLTNFQLPVPPLAEQRRIVAKVEELLARVNAARERLAKVPAILKRFRQSILAAACSGQLTADWREQNDAAKLSVELFKRIQHLREKHFQRLVALANREGRRKPKDQRNNKRSDSPVITIAELPKSWHVSRLDDLCHQITDGTHYTPNYTVEGMPFLSVKNVRPFKIRDEDIKYISRTDFESNNARCNPEPGDILYTKVGATYGFAARNTLTYDFSIYVSLALLKPVNDGFTSEFAEVVMNSPLVFDQATDRVSGSGVPDLHLIEIRDFAIPLPPVKEQREIVHRVTALFALADKIEARVQAATARVEKITQAILAKAFRGELVPTEAELARAAGRDYEPASVLLARVNAQRSEVGNGEHRPSKPKLSRPGKTKSPRRD